MKIIFKTICYLSYPFVNLYKWSEKHYLDGNESIYSPIEQNRYDDFGKARKVIETMTWESRIAAQKYIHLFSKKWHDNYLRGYLDILYNAKFDELFNEFMTEK